MTDPPAKAQAFPATLPNTLAPFETLPAVCRDLRLIEGTELVEALVAARSLDVLGRLGIQPGALESSPAALAESEEEIVTITGEIVLSEPDAEGDVIVTIVTETDTYVISEDSKAADISSQSGKKVTAKGAIKVTEVGSEIAVQEYVLVPGETPPVGAME